MSTEAKIPEADLKNVNLKPTETVEKVILPSAEGKFAAANAGISPAVRQGVTGRYANISGISPSKFLDIYI